jgi:hypothetical protein
MNPVGFLNNVNVLPDSSSPCWAHRPRRTSPARHRPRRPIHNQLVHTPCCSALALSSNNHRLFFQKNLLVVFTLAQKPHRARYVRTFSIRLGSSSALSSFYRLLRTALSNMSQLTSLDIFLHHAASWVMHTRDDSTYYITVSNTLHLPFILTSGPTRRWK